MKYEDNTREAVTLLKQLIATPSISRNELYAADIIEQFLTDKGCDTHRLGNNVWAVAEGFDNSRPTILLDAHIDTVKPVNGWNHDPFTPEETADGTIYGLGSNDDGGSLVALMQVFLMMRNGQDNKYARNFNLIFSASAEEEVSGKEGIEKVLPELPRIDFCIVGEPTGMQLAVAEKGLMVVDAVAHGKAGHAARNEGVNAIYIATDDIQWIRSHTFERQTDLLGPVKMTVTIINAGTQHNVIPDECKFTIDVRSNECYTNQELLDSLRKNLQSELKERSTRLNSSRVPLDHPFVLRAKQLGLTTFGSPTLSNQALMPFPSVKIGPGDSARSHTANEFIRISEIDDAIDLYMRLLDFNFTI